MERNQSAAPACPACGEQRGGYEYRMTETHIMVGSWGAGAEAGDHSGEVSQSLVKCCACGAKFQLAALQRRGLA
jgi:hypothetical protein